MSDIRHQVSAAFIGDLTESLKVDGSCVCAGSANDQLGLAFHRNALNLVIIDIAVGINTVGNALIVHSGNIVG